MNFKAEGKQASSKQAGKQASKGGKQAMQHSAAEQDRGAELDSDRQHADKQQGSVGLVPTTQDAATVTVTQVV